MSDLISRSALIDALRCYQYPYGVEVLVSNQPAVDAVEVCRCKDCEYWGGVVFGNVCRRWSAPLAGMKNCTQSDDFCSYGERREDG